MSRKQKNYRKFVRKPEKHNLESWKIEKQDCGQPEKAYFFCGKTETDLRPPIPGTLNILYKGIHGMTLASRQQLGTSQ